MQEEQVRREEKKSCGMNKNKLISLYSSLAFCSHFCVRLHINDNIIEPTILLQLERTKKQMNENTNAYTYAHVQYGHLAM